MIKSSASSTLQEFPTSPISYLQPEYTLKNLGYLNQLFFQSPVSVCRLGGPEFIFEMVNPSFQQLFLHRPLLGRPLTVAFPEIIGEPILDKIKNTLLTGDSYKSKEVLIPGSGQEGSLEDGYFDFVYQAMFDEHCEIDGLLVYCFDVTELVLAKLRAEENERNLQNLVRTARYGLMILRGPEYIIETANQPLIGIWGETLENVLGKPLAEVFPDMKDQVFPALLKKVYETGISYGTDQQLVYYDTPAGRMTKYIRFNYDPILDGTDHICGIIVSAEEITATVQNRLLLNKIHEQEQQINKNLLAVERVENETRFRNLVQSAPVAICILKGRDLVVELANDMVLKIWLRTGEIINKPLKTVLPELVDQPFLKLLDDVYTSGREHIGNEEKAVIYYKGLPKTLYFNHIYKPLKDKNGFTTSIMVVATDVTGQVHAKHELERAEEILRFSVEAANVGTWLIDIQSKTMITSMRQRNLFGFISGQEVSMKAMIQQISPDYRDKICLAIETVMASGGTVDQEFPVTGFEDGVLRWIKSMGSVVPDEAGRLSFFSGVCIEITEQKEDEIRKNNFINMVSHELKTPLTSLKGYIQLLLHTAEKQGDSFMSRTLRKADSRLDKMTGLINGFLNVSLLESGKISLRIQEFEIQGLIKEVIEETSMNSPGTPVVFTPGKTIFLLADRDKIGQVVINLISNAIKYSPLGEVIEIECICNVSTVDILVRDRGKGIYPKDLPHIFERYYRVENMENKIIAGFGIGLYLCWEIIQSHQGKISVKSEPGNGSEFCFSLPLVNF